MFLVRQRAPQDFFLQAQLREKVTAQYLFATIAAPANTPPIGAYTLYVRCAK
jgi:hypothetical protein